MQGRHVHIYIFVCVYVCLCMYFIYRLGSKNNYAAASRTSSETEEPCNEVTGVMKLYVCKSMYCSCKFVNGCAKAQALQAAE